MITDLLGPNISFAIVCFHIDRWARALMPEMYMLEVLSEIESFMCSSAHEWLL